MSTLREAAQQALEALEQDNPAGRTATITALRAALAEPTGKESLQVPADVAATLTTTDIAWLETRRLTKLWQELGQMRWMGADEGWDRAIEAVRNRLDKECQDVLDWKGKADQSHATAIELLQKMQGLNAEPQQSLEDEQRAINAEEHRRADALAEPVQEPVAKVELMTSGGNAGLATRIVEIDDHLRERLRPGQLLYAAPPQRKPLTEEEIINIGKAARAVEGSHILPVTFARAIERAHGIGGNGG